MLASSLGLFYNKIQKHFQNVLLVGMASEINTNYTYKCVDRTILCCKNLSFTIQVVNAGASSAVFRLMHVATLPLLWHMISVLG